MKLYWGPHTCAIGIHLLLEEAGVPYEAVKLDVQRGENETPAFLDVNPKGKVPTLVRDDGRVLTEFGAIATWIALTHADQGLLPTAADERIRVAEVLDYVVGTVHGQGFARVFKPERFEPQDVLHATLGLGSSSVQAQGREMVEKAFAILDRDMQGRDYVAGSFGIADAALFYVERWAPTSEIELPSNLAAHLTRMRQRPAVKRAMEAEGEA